MALTTYAQLKTAIETWLARSGDSEISGNAADFITLAESRLNRVVPLRLTQTQTVLTATIGSRSITLPTDFVEPIALIFAPNSGASGVQYEVIPQAMGSQPLLATSGQPSRWFIITTTIVFDKLCDAAYTFLFRYRQSLALSDINTTNVLLTAYPDVYLQACLVEAEFFQGQFDAAQIRMARLQNTIDEIAWITSRSKAVAKLSVDDALLLSNATPGYFDFTNGV